MQSSIPLSDLLGFVPKPKRTVLIKGLEGKDPQIIPLLEEFTFESYDYYDKKAELEGPQAWNHYGWLLVELANYYAAVGNNDRADKLRHEAWTNFVNPQVRGHDDKAHRIVIESPALLQKYPNMAQYYRGLNPSPATLAQFSGLDNIIKQAKSISGHV